MDVDGSGRERYFEDYPEGAVFDLGELLVDGDEIVAFARRYDPQPFFGRGFSFAPVDHRFRVRTGETVCLAAPDRKVSVPGRERGEATTHQCATMARTQGRTQANALDPGIRVDALRRPGSGRWLARAEHRGNRAGVRG